MGVWWLNVCVDAGVEAAMWQRWHSVASALIVRVDAGDEAWSGGRLGGGASRWVRIMRGATLRVGDRMPSFRRVGGASW